MQQFDMNHVQTVIIYHPQLISAVAGFAKVGISNTGTPGVLIFIPGTSTDRLIKILGTII